MVCLGGAAPASRGRGVLPPRTAQDLTRTALLPAAGVLGLAALLPVLALTDQSLGERLIVQAGLFVGSAALCARFLLLSRWHVTLLAAERCAAEEARARPPSSHGPQHRSATSTTTRHAAITRSTPPA